MGFAKQLFGVLGGAATKDLFGKTGGSSDSASSSASSKDANAEAEETARRKRAAQMAGSAPGQLTQAGGDTSAATLSRKTLLGS